MLPSSKGHTGFGGRKRGAHMMSTLYLVAILVLLVGAIASCWSYWNAHTQVTSTKKDLANLQRQLEGAREQRREEMAKHHRLEDQHHLVSRQLQEKSHALQDREMQLAEERRLKAADAEACRQKSDDTQDQFNYEVSVNAALKKHLENIELAHKNREIDWHQLAEKWKEYETQAIAENHRLLIENKRLQSLEIPTTFQDPELPLEEPKYRPETRFDATFNEPAYQAHHQRTLQQHEARGDMQADAALPKVLPSQAAADARDEHADKGHHRDEHVDMGHPRSEFNHHQDEHMDMGHPRGEFNNHRDDVYHHHYADTAWGHEEHFDPMDHYWMNDGFAPGHDNFHGDTWHQPDHGHQAEHIPQWQQNEHGHHEERRDPHAAQWQDSHAREEWRDPLASGEHRQDHNQHGQWQDPHLPPTHGRHEHAWRDEHGMHQGGGRMHEDAHVQHGHVPQAHTGHAATGGWHAGDPGHGAHVPAPH